MESCGNCPAMLSNICTVAVIDVDVVGGGGVIVVLCCVVVVGL